MNTSASAVGITSLTLKPNEFVAIERPRGVRIGSRQGTLWLTIDGVLRDIVLSPGESFEVSCRGSTLVGTTGGSAVVEITRASRTLHRPVWIGRLLAAGHRAGRFMRGPRFSFRAASDGRSTA